MTGERKSTERKSKRLMKHLWLTGMSLCVTAVMGTLTADRMQVKGAGAVYAAYQEYEARFSQIQTIEDIRIQGYQVIEKHVFDVPLQQTAEVSRPDDPYRIKTADAVALQEVPTVRFYCALEDNSHRAAVFLADREGRIVYKTNQLECNYAVLGEMNQPIYDLVSVSFQDLNGDNLTDIILIAGCVQSAESGQRQKYKIGEVLFQKEQMEEQAEELNFYRDWRVNDKINRYGMNQSAKSIRSFIRDGQSTEFLYKAATEEELLKNGFQVIEEQSHGRFFEKLGNLKLFPGFFSLGDYDIFMIYLINEQGSIVWRFEPMGEYDNLYALKGISTADLDGDGMKDILVLARYSKEDDGSISVDIRYAIYYQRTDGFEQDTEFDLKLSDRSKEEQTVSNLVNEIRFYWGWQIHPKSGYMLQEDKGR